MITLTLRAVSFFLDAAFMEEPGKPFWPKRLVRDMTERLDYDARVRPVADYSLPINVTLRMNLYQIVDVVSNITCSK